MKLTEKEEAVLSNGIVGEKDVVYSLENKGLLKSTKEEDDLCYFDLTEEGEKYFQDNFVIKTTNSKEN